MENQKQIEVKLNLTPEQLQNLYAIACRDNLGISNLASILEEIIDDTPKDWFN